MTLNLKISKHWLAFSELTTGTDLLTQLQYLSKHEFSQHVQSSTDENTVQAQHIESTQSSASHPGGQQTLVQRSIASDC
jgi:hypothetical protein